jgi:hypothetical protein
MLFLPMLRVWSFHIAVCDDAILQAPGGQCLKQDRKARAYGVRGAEAHSAASGRSIAMMQRSAKLNQFSRQLEKIVPTIAKK